MGEESPGTCARWWCRDPPGVRGGGFGDAGTGQQLWGCVAAFSRGESRLGNGTRIVNFKWLLKHLSGFRKET